MTPQSGQPSAPCPACGTPVDKLRAGHVALLGEGFCYFCDLACKERYLSGDHALLLSEPTAAPPAVRVGPAPPDLLEPSRPLVPRSAAFSGDEADGAVPPDLETAAPLGDAPPSLVPFSRALTPDRRRVVVLSFAAALLGAVSAALTLLGEGGERLRLPAAVLSIAALLLAQARRSRGPLEPPLWVTVWPLASCALALGWATLAREPRAHGIAGALGLSSVVGALTVLWVERTLAQVPALSNDETVASMIQQSLLARVAKLGAERGLPLLSLMVTVASFVTGTSLRLAVASGALAAVGFNALAALWALSLHLAHAEAEASAHGIQFRDAAAFDEAGQTDVAVLCSRGTVLLGEPEIVAVEGVGANDPNRVLALAAGAETGSTHPFAVAVLRAARVRGVVEEAVRGATLHTGLGVAAFNAAGERIVVGNRSFLLREGVGVALTEGRVSELEAQGRSVMLVAVGAKLVGYIALQDGLRPGARAAVDLLVRRRIEPVLISGESRETCETIGRALNIDHVRPEVLPTDRATEVRALIEGGHHVAVLGHANVDDAALAAADVSVALGEPYGEAAVRIAHDDIRTATLSLALAKRCRERGLRLVSLCLAPGVLSALALAFGLSSTAIAPAAALLTVLLCLAQRRPEPLPLERSARA